MAHSFTLDVPLPELPLALAELHRGLETGAVVEFEVIVNDVSNERELISRVFDGAGFGIESMAVDDAPAAFRVAARRRYELPDHVGADMRLLLVGLNPSPAASDAGVGFHRPGNRFWPALLASGLASVDRDPRHLLVHHRIGMTDLVKRTTARADELDRSEFADGIERLDHLAGWLEPRLVCFVGLQGWRAAVDRKAKAGPHDHRIGDRPTYVMPNPSGLNANHHLDDFVAHFQAAASLADSSN